MSNSIFGRFAPAYWSVNLPVMPLKARSKRPFISAWQTLCERMPTLAEQQEWLAQFDASNLGLPLGGQAGICMIDIDSDDPDLNACLTEILPETPWVRRGKKGAALAYKWSGETNFKIKGVAGEMLVELLGHGNQLVLPPSIHPETRRPYVATANLWEVVEELPVLPSGIESLLRAELLARNLTKRTRGRRLPQSSSVIAQNRIAIPDKPGIEHFLAVALSDACKMIVAAPESTRNTTLFGKSKDLARHVAAAGGGWEPFARELEEAGLAVGLEPSEIASTIASGWNSGSQEPTRWIQIAKEYIYLGAQDRFYRPESGSYLNQSGFNGMHGRAHDDKGSFAQFLLTNGLILKVQDIIYKPAEASGPIEIAGLVYFNTYQPSMIEPAPGDAGPFVEFLEFLIPDAAERQHTLQVMAHTVRNPGQRVRHALLFRTRGQGVGKSMLFEIWGHLVGTRNVRQTSSLEMAGTFNGWLKENTLLICPELNIGAGLSTYNELKELITANQIYVNEKHLSPRRWDIYSTMVFSSNLEVPLLIEADDRRIFVVDSPAVKRDAEYYRTFVSWWEANLGVIRAYLEEVDLSDFNAFAPPPMTEGKARLIKRSDSPLTQDLAYLIASRTGCFVRDVVTLGRVRVEIDSRTHVSDRQLASALQQLGAVSLGQHRTRLDRQSLWAIRNVDYWISGPGSEMVEEFERTRGLWADLDSPYIGVRRWPVGEPFPERYASGSPSEADLLKLLRKLKAPDPRDGGQLGV